MDLPPIQDGKGDRLLTINALIAATQFGKGSIGLRMAHACIGSTALVLLVVQAVLGTWLGSSV